MITIIVLFMVATMATNAVIATIWGNTAAIYSILALLIFGSIGLTFIKEIRRWAWIGFMVAILLYVAVGALAPYQDMLGKTISAVFAVIGVVIIKRPILRYVRKDEQRTTPRIPTWGRWLLRVF